jgi:hypothetical protein
MPLPQNNTKIAKQTVKIGLKIDFRGNEERCISYGIVEIDAMRK